MGSCDAVPLPPGRRGGGGGAAGRRLAPGLRRAGPRSSSHTGTRPAARPARQPAGGRAGGPDRGGVGRKARGGAFHPPPPPGTAGPQLALLPSDPRERRRGLCQPPPAAEGWYRGSLASSEWREAACLQPETRRLGRGVGLRGAGGGLMAGAALGYLGGGRLC